MGRFKNARVTLINPQVEQLYSSMVPGLIMKRFNYDESSIDLMQLTQFSDCRFYKDTLISVNPKQKFIKCEKRGRIDFDILSLSTGSVTKKIASFGNSNFTYLKPFDTFISTFETWIKTFDHNKNQLRIGIIGGGVAAVEIISAVAKRIQNYIDLKKNPPKLEIFLITKEESPFSSFGEQMKKQCIKVLSDYKVTILPNFFADKLEENRVFSNTGSSIQLDFGIIATGPSPQAWIKNSGLELCNQGFIRVGRDLSSIGFENIFATGDVASLPNCFKLSKSGVVAVRQGKILATNIQKALDGKKLLFYKPQRLWLSLIGTGEQKAILNYGSFATRGSIFFHLKDVIDRKFISKFKSFNKKMAQTEKHQYKSSEKERCGGCGSKVGSEILRSVLKEFLEDPVFPNIDKMDEDAGIFLNSSGDLNLQTIDGFRQLIDEPYNMGLITSYHSVSDITAMGGTPKTALALVGVPLNDEKLMKNDFRLALRGILTALKSQSVDLIGGHTNESEYLSLALAITGSAQKSKIIKKNTIKPGNRIILTQPIGAGVIFAGLMDGLTKGKWIYGVISEITRDRPSLLDTVSRFANACTDVTGFGLTGHLVEMTREASYGIRVNLEKIPFFEGAAELSKSKVRSSLYPQNIKTAHEVTSKVMHDPRYELCFDPQTAGGLLLSVDEELSDSCIRTLQTLGYNETREIGSVVNNQKGVKITL